MNPTTKKMFAFILGFIGLTAVFGLFTGKYLLSTIISLFVSISLFYGPKKTKATIATEENTETNKEVTN